MAVNAEFVERYELELRRNPRSRVFAALAEAYRKLGQLDRAEKICKLGVRFHPDFAGGHVAYAKVLVDLDKNETALGHLEKATKLSPDNLLAHSLLGETLIKLRRPKDALKAFKMVLFLNPGDEKALSAVRKWEFLTADEYAEDVFAMRPVFENSEEPRPSVKSKALERAISLADAYTVRGDLDAALKVLEDARKYLGHDPELEKRYRLLQMRVQTLNQDSEAEDFSEEEADFSQNSLSPNERERKKAVLKMLLQRINTRRA